MISVINFVVHLQLVWCSKQICCSCVITLYVIYRILQGYFVSITEKKARTLAGNSLLFYRLVIAHIRTKILTLYLILAMSPLTFAEIHQSGPTLFSSLTLF